ncbi:MAG: TauD/TfdA family dioxygenase, partial [Endozoicomonadaceae bacterium]|nr:TauD/TfdA family dioxygenase [Endozoicomonadaceae bacterium]
NVKDIKKLSPLWSTRRPANSHDNAPKITVAHPVLIDNSYLYISENTIDIIQDKKKIDNSSKIKKSLLEKILQKKNIYSHKWEVGDLLLFDNSKLLHRREKFCGLRFIKGMKIYPDPEYNPTIPTVKID